MADFARWRLANWLRDRFGAVMEEFEVRDALESILSTKQEFAMAY